MQRLKGKVAIVTGAGQTPGTTIGNGRATAILFAREGAKVMLVDRDRESATETQQMIEAEGFESIVWTMDVTHEDHCIAMARACKDHFGRIDILHNNVGIGTGDRGATSISLDAWDNIMTVNLTSMLLTCKHVIPCMREQGSGVITNISSVAAWAATGMVAYKTSKAAILALTQNIAMGNAHYGIRANTILPGLMNTPMAIEGYTATTGKPREEVIAARDSRVPLGKKMGTAWDVAHAAVFLASDEAGFITGVNLPVDGGQSLRVG